MKDLRNKRRNGEERGITLVALIITIIVLIILAAVTIYTMWNNGFVEKAINSAEDYENAQLEEQETLTELEKQILALEQGLPENSKEIEAGTEVKMPKEWYSTTSAYVSTEDGAIAKKAIKVASVTAIAVGGGESVPVPEKFYYVGGTISSGVVISDDIRDKNKYAGQEDVPAGVKYESDGTVKQYTEEAYQNLTAEEKKELILGNQFVWIPCNEKDYKKIEWKKGSTNLWNEAYETTPHGTEISQIQKYGGFYIARYEAGTSKVTLSTKVNFAAANTASSWGNDNFSIREGLNHTASGNITSKAGEIPYYHADYFTAVALSNRMYQTEYVQSVLTTGTMWDAMMKFIAGGNDAEVTESDWGNYTNGNVTYTAGKGRYAEINSNTGAMTTAFTVNDGSYHYGIQTTAFSENAKKKNLYDVAGNLYERTQESTYPNYSIESYMLRGGSFNDSYLGYPACYRCNNIATLTITNMGFRPALYIK